MLSKETIEREVERRYPENILPAGKETGKKQRRNQETFIEGGVYAATKAIPLLEALKKIIAMNMQQARDQYGDVSRCESWACVITAREAINNHNNQ